MSGPVLDIHDENGELHWRSPFMLISRMLYPDDTERADELATVCCTQLVLELLADDQLFPAMPKSVIKALLNSPNEDELEKELDAARKGGHIAGFMLLVIVQASLHQNDYATVNAARELASILYSVDRAKAFHFWSKYKSVSHLWAAMIVWQEDLKLDENWCPVTLDGLPGFLSLTELLRALGERHVPKRSKAPVLDANRTWRPPTPKSPIRKECNIQIPPLTPWAEQKIEEFRAAGRKLPD